MGVFEFIIVLVAMSTIAKVLRDRHETRLLADRRGGDGSPDLQAIIDTVDNMNTRLVRVEEERDFYKQLLEAPAKDDDSDRPGMLPR